MVFVVSFVVLYNYFGVYGQARFMRYGKVDQKENKDINPHISLDFDLNKRKYQYVLFVIFTITFPFFIIIIGTKIK